MALPAFVTLGVLALAAWNKASDPPVQRLTNREGGRAAYRVSNEPRDAGAPEPSERQQAREGIEERGEQPAALPEAGQAAAAAGDQPDAGTAAAAPPDEAARQPGGEPSAGASQKAPAAAHPEREQLRAQVQELGREIAQLRSALEQQRQSGAARSEELERQGEAIGALEQQAGAIEQSREARAARFADAATELRAGELQLTYGNESIGAQVEQAESLLGLAASSAAALGSPGEVLSAQAALRAIEDARYWLGESDLWNARLQLIEAEGAALRGQRIAQSWAFPLVQEGAGMAEAPATSPELPSLGESAPQDGPYQSP